MNRNALMRYVCLAGCAMIAAACAEVPPRPLLSAWSEAPSFGYQDRRRDDTHVEVTYTTPFERTVLDEDRRGPADQRLRALATDIALWRAAEIGRDGGFPALKVTSSTTSTKVRVYDESTPPRYILAGPQGGALIPVSPQREERSAWLQGVATLDVEFERAKGEGAYDVAATIDRLSKTYQGVLAR
jgi:hypothetical protein